MRAGMTTAAVLAVAGLCACGGDGGDEVGAGVGAVAAHQGGTDGATSSSPPGPAGGSGSAEGSGGSGDVGSSSSGPPAASPSMPCGTGGGGPEIPDDASPPTTIPGSEPTEVPNGLMSDEMLPQFGALVVDVEPQGCIDIATRFRANQRVQMFTHADDGKVTRVEVFAPDGESIAHWETGQPETLEGWDFFNDTPLPADGVYVFRVTHQRGSDDPFMIAFYGQE